MAANDYYHSYTPDHAGRAHSNAPSSPISQTSHLPQDSYTPYSSRPLHEPSPYPGSPVSDTSYRPYQHSNFSETAPYLSSGGKNHDSNPYADDVPLRPHPQKSDNVIHNHEYDDSAITDRPPPGKAKGRKKGFFSRKIPWVVYTLTLIQCVVFIAELGKNGALTKTPIQIHPQFNPMIGPSPYVLINMGARYVPCMRKTEQIDFPRMPCPKSTSSDLDNDDNSCRLNDLCGFGASTYTNDSLPHQWYRFILPIFLHGGFIHIGFNMLLQILLGGDMEREIGSIRFIVVYLSSGIFGFVLGGNYAPEGIASTGASGSLFGIIALLLLDLLYHWSERKSPWVDLFWIFVDIVISFALGLLPGLDNFSHIGGFLMGLVLGICLLHSPEPLRRKVGADLPPYASVQRSRPNLEFTALKGFIKEPTSFFKGRKPLWWAWWLVRAGALVGVLASFIALLGNFYKETPDKCDWCHYFTCIDYKDWCKLGSLDFKQQPAKEQSPSKRSFLELAMPVVQNAMR